MSKTVKNIIMFVVIVAVIAVVYFIFFGKKSPATNAPTGGSSLQTSAGAPVTGIVQTNPTTSVEASKIGQEFINQLLNLQSIKLDDEVFSSLSFQSLEDFTIVLVQPGNEGRPNPFAPFGSDGSNTNSGLLPGVNEGGLTVTPINQLPGGTNDGELWSTVSSGGITLYYMSGWTASAQSSGTQVVGYTFTLPGGASIGWGGAQSTCTASATPAFQYGVSTQACVKGKTAVISGQNPSVDAKLSFGDFVGKNK